MNTTELRPAQIARKLCLLLSVILGLAAIAARADDAVTARYFPNSATLNDPARVDVALVLAVDVSSSIQSSERRFQREAYAQALADERVARLALGGGAGRVAIAYMEWSGSHYQRVHLPMRVMSSPQELAAFAAEILAIEDRAADPMYTQPTAIGNALIAAEAAMAELDVPARDYVIDISGDGVTNDGAGVAAARHRLLAMGLTVNGLPIEVTSDVNSYEQEDFNTVTRYYADCVIGGPGAFHVVARGFGDVRETLIMKLMLEMAEMRPEEKRRIAAAWNGGTMNDYARIIPATVLQLAPQGSAPPPPSDCGDLHHNASNPFNHR